jgi:uncharacterized protein
MSIARPSAAQNSKLSNGYLFLPRPLARGTFLKWLRRTHAWLGLWGAVLGLLFGSTGILLNHRDILKIPAAKTEQQETQLALPDERPADAKALAAWLGLQLGTDLSHARILQEPSKTVTWNGVSVQQPARWQIMLRGPQRGIHAEYWQGNAYVSVKRSEANVFAFLTNLHKGAGLSMGWVLLVDSLGGALIMLSLTGVLLWTRLHGRRLGAAGLALSSLSLAIWFAWQAV